jgi:hypothetical protein
MLHLSAAFLPSAFRVEPSSLLSRTKELTDDEDETSSSPKRQRMAEEEIVADEPAATVPRGVHGAGGHIRGLGKRVISRHPSPALRGHLDTVPEHSATINLPERK